MSEHDLVGSRFGHLRVVGVVGAGGMRSGYLLLGRSAEARPLAEGIFLTGYRRRPFLELCEKSGIAPPVSGST